MNDIKAYLAPAMEQVERTITNALSSDVSLLDQMNRSLREHPGKMLRPMLALLCAGAVCKPNEDTIKYAAATELLHNATLLHDDVVDGAELRRGLPTVASILGGPAAVLIGDFWLVRAVRTILEGTNNKNEVIALFASTLGHLAEGELLQMEKATKCDTTQADYERIIYSKTASLFETAAVSAALSVNAPKDQTEALRNFARTLGIAFQIKDDIMDYGDGSIGKPTGIDLREQKITQPLLCALEDATPEQAQDIRITVSGIADNPSWADKVQAFVKAHNGVAKAMTVLDKFIAQAQAQLQTLADTPEKLYLARLAQFVGAREN